MKIYELGPYGIRKAISIDSEAPAGEAEWVRGREISNRVRHYLKDEGFYATGGGSFASVYSHSTKNIIVKVTNRPDPCYKEFYEYIKKNKSVHMPRIAKPISMSEGNYVYFMEKLSPLHDKKIRLAGMYFRALTNSEWDKKRFDLQDKRVAAIVVRENRSLFIELNKLKRYFKNKCRMDTHGDNFMIRPATGDIVIIDPVSYMISGKEKT